MKRRIGFAIPNRSPAFGTSAIMSMKSHVNRNCVQGLFLAVFLLGSLVGLSSVTAAQTGEPSREPILRIETGMHTGIIRQIDIDRSGKFLVTASDDKTVRVWEVPSGRLLRTIRVPISRGTDEGLSRSDGKLYAVAISPDGNTIAAGGWTTSERSNGESIYLFDRSSGRMINRLSGLPVEVSSLAYSPDGRYLAVTLGLIYGVRVYTTAKYAQIGKDDSYLRDARRADFDDSDRLVTTSSDGYIRIYAPPDVQGLRLIAKQKPADGKSLHVKFSPDGQRIAVEMDGSMSIAVLSARDLSTLYAPDTTGLKFKDSPLAWSPEGTTLYTSNATVATDGTIQGFVRAWTDGGRGGYQDRALQIQDLNHELIALRNGGIIYVSNKGIGLAGEGAAPQTLQTSSIADYRVLKQRLLLSQDGSGLQFAYEAAGKSLARFWLKDRRLEPGSESPPLDWRPPLKEGDPARLKAWLNLYAGTFKLDKPLISGLLLSSATSPDGNSLLIGTSSYLRYFDFSGGERWSVPTPDAALAVNISTDGKLAVAGYGDGTIRWHRMTDGKELLAFFPHADRKRWVLWTPSGYYDASPGAEELIGWHINNGKDQVADFFPVGQFRSTYYRPDLISKILGTGDEARALQLANEEHGRKTQTTTVAQTVAQMLPPVVEIASPSDNSDVSSSEITIRYSLRTPSGEPATSVRALVDGRPVTGNRQLTREDASASGVRELKLSVPERDSEVSIIAENRFAVSVPATIRLKWHRSAPTTESFVIQPKLYVLAIGVSQYQNPSYSLKFAAKDAKDFVAATVTQKGFLYRDVVVKVLTDDQATKDNVLDGLDWIRKETTSKDVAMVFFAGHGLNDQNGVYYFLPYNTDLEKLLRTGVPFTDIKNTVQSLAGKTLFFIDTCHSGNVLGGRRGLADDLNGIINELSSAESGAVVFAASTGNQYSLEDAKWNNGAFTKALVEGFMGRADYTGKGRITINMLDLYISERVKELTGGKQTPTTAKPNTIQDFPIAVKK
jgi:WD40 repeat protein